ncbi:MAG: extensin family protein [Hyphomicrobiaceae bacterium]
MPVLTTGRSIFAIVVILQFSGISAGAANMPLPDRNPMRVPAAPLPERNPIREAGLPLPERNPNRISPETETAHASPPEATADPDAKADAASDAKPDDAAEAKPDPTKWSDAEISAERSRCEVMLKDLPVVTEPHDPIRKGECGAVAPVTLIRVGKDPEVRLVPPATITCNMVAAMAHWIEKDVQPAARKILGAPITRMNIIGDYSCRQALGRTSTRLSEHGLANALDIHDFVTERGDNADLTRDWGPTVRDIAARVAAEAAAEAARKAAAAAAAEAARKAVKEAKDAAPKAAEKVAKLAASKPEPPPATATTGNVSAEAGGRSLSRSEIRRARHDARQRGDPRRRAGHSVSGDAGISRAEASPSSGKKSSAARPAEDEKPNARRQFLREIHAQACGTFGTVLGPEANEAHRNHFHVDMAKRRHRSFCE